MLVEFTVENYRSFKAAKTLSMLPDKKLKESSDIPLIHTGNKKIPYLLRMAGIYGANASGKSNLITAFRDAGRIIEHGMHPGYIHEPLPIYPFKLDAPCRAQPSRFTFHIIIDAVRYIYSFAAYPERIAEESLYAYYSAQPTMLFEREGMYFTFGAKLKGENRKIEQRLAQFPKRLFLTQAADNSHELLSRLSQWFASMLTGNSPPPLRSTSNFCKDNKKALMQFLSDADIAIDDMEWEEEEFNLPDGLRDMIAKDLDRDMYSPIIHTTVIFKRKDNQGALITFDMDEDESDGTKKLYRLFPLWEQMAKSRNLLCYDELEEALHPNLLEFLLRCIARLPETCGSQLIFTTHNVEILEMNVLRRDCVWFTEKDAHHASDLYELSSFDSIRPSTLIKKLYLHGKFGAVPRIPLEH